MARQITIDDRETIEITNGKGEVTGSFLFNPTDFDILKRYESVQKHFENLKIDESGDQTESAFKISKEIKEQFDFLLNSDASESLFKNCNPLSPMQDGRMFFEYVFDTIAKFIEKELNTRLKKTKSRVDEYTAKYHK